MTEVDMPSSCFVQLAFDEQKKYLVIEIPDMELITNQYLKLINVIYIQSLIRGFKVGLKFLTVTRYLRNKTLLFHNIDSHIHVLWPGKSFSGSKQSEIEDHLVIIFITDEQSQKEGGS